MVLPCRRATGWSSAVIFLVPSFNSIGPTAGPCCSPCFEATVEAASWMRQRCRSDWAKLIIQGWRGWGWECFAGGSTWLWVGSSVCRQAGEGPSGCAVRGQDGRRYVWSAWQEPTPGCAWGPCCAAGVTLLPGKDNLILHLLPRGWPGIALYACGQREVMFPMCHCHTVGSTQLHLRWVACRERFQLMWPFPISAGKKQGHLVMWCSSSPPLWSLWIILGWGVPVICTLNFITEKFSCTFFPVNRIAFSLEEKNSLISRAASTSAR